MGGGWGKRLPGLSLVCLFLFSFLFETFHLRIVLLVVW